MVPYDKVMLNKLLDSYESSLLSIGENVRTVHIELRFTKKTMPEYFNESSGDYEQIHIWAEELEDKNLITILWKGNKRGHIIEKIRLNEERIKEAYRYVHREPKKSSEEKAIHLLKEIQQETDTPVCQRFISYLLERIEGHLSVKEYFAINDVKGIEKLLKVIRGIEENTAPLYVREFSIRVLNDSKEFEKMEGKVTNIFRRFREESQEMETAELLSEYNIFHTPNYVYLKGIGKIRIGEEVINLSNLKQGIGISGDDIGRLEFILGDAVQKVVTIENLTTFFRYHEPDSLIIYLGGYHNSNRRKLLTGIYHIIPEAVYYHFGDMDAGGFRIFYDLRDKTGIPFQMHKMDLETLIQYKEYAKPLTNDDRKRLEKLMEHEELSETIQYMLKNNIKLEQESILL